MPTLTRVHLQPCSIRAILCCISRTKHNLTLTICHHRTQRTYRIPTETLTSILQCRQDITLRWTRSDTHLNRHGTCTRNHILVQRPRIRKFRITSRIIISCHTLRDWRRHECRIIVDAESCCTTADLAFVTGTRHGAACLAEGRVVDERVATVAFAAVFEACHAEVLGCAVGETGFDGHAGAARCDGAS
jgi:hypothetical protein